MTDYQSPRNRLLLEKVAAMLQANEITGPSWAEMAKELQIAHAGIGTIVLAAMSEEAAHGFLATLEETLRTNTPCTVAVRITITPVNTN